MSFTQCMVLREWYDNGLRFQGGGKRGAEVLELAVKGLCRPLGIVTMRQKSVGLQGLLFRKNIHITVLYPGFIDTPLNDMLPSRPFLINVEKGAQVIARLIEKKVKSSTVPVFPWNIVGRILKILPTRVVARM